MVRRKKRLANRERTAHHPLGRIQFVLRFIYDGETVEQPRHSQTFGAEQSFPDGDGAAVKRLCIGICTALVTQSGKIAVAECDIEIVLALGEPDPHLEGAMVKGFGVIEPIQMIVNGAQVVEALGDVFLRYAGGISRGCPARADN